MDTKTFIDDVIKAMPSVTGLIDTFDPAVAGAVNVADAIINAGEAMAQRKAMYTPEEWAANAALVNAGAADIAQAEKDNP